MSANRPSISSAMARADRRAVPLKAICSSRWDTPLRSNCSCRAPTSTQAPTDAVSTVCMGSVIIRRRLSSVVVLMVTQSRFLQAHRQYTVPPDQYYCEETPFVPLGQTGPRAGLGDGAVALWRLLPHRETLPDEPWPKIQPVRLPMLLRTHWPELPAQP